MAKTIRKFYFPNNERVDGDSIAQFIDLMSDIWFVDGVVEATVLQAKRSTGRTYFYRFDLQSNLNVMKMNSGAVAFNLSGVSHADDLYYVFR